MATIAPQRKGVGIRGRKTDSAIVGLLLVLGVYLPSSTAETISVPFLYAGYALCLILLLFLFRSGNRIFPGLLAPLSIVPLLLTFTLTSGLYSYGFGILVAYAMLSLLFAMDFGGIRLPEWIYGLYAAANAINIAIGAAILAGNPAVCDFLVDHYSVAYPELVPDMLFVRKPVLTFGPHSVAAFFQYLFFYTSLQTYVIKHKRLFLIFALCYLALMMALLSVSGLVLAAVAGMQLLYYLWISPRRMWIAPMLVLIVTGIPAGFGLLLPSVNNWADVVETARTTMTASNNGFAGRLAPGGTMSYDLWYLRNNFLAPVGLSYTEETMFGDCGPIEYLLRGSLLLLIAVYGGLGYFLKRNLLARKDACFLFAIILAFELGYTWLPSLRTLFILPFVVIYLNDLRRSVVGDGIECRSRTRMLSAGRQFSKCDP